MIKPGYKTSEFWFTLVTFLFSGLYLLGVIGDIQYKDELIANVTHAVESCILISGQLAVLYKYIKGRSDIKKSWWSTVAQEEKPKIEQGKKTNVKKSGPRKNPKPSSKNKKSTR